MIRLFSLNLFLILPYLAFSQSSEFDEMINEHLSFTIPVINVSEAYRIKDKVIFLDAREEEEYNVSHISGALHVGYNKFNESKLKQIDKSKKIVVYCSIGYRSEKISERLKKLGFKNVYNLYGSLFAWVNGGYEVVNSQGKNTHDIHTYNKDWSKWVVNKKYRKKY